jgi:uncharacterized protein (TIGR02145 family)
MKSSHKTPWTAAIFIVFAVFALVATQKELSAGPISFKTVTIGVQQWMAENLSTSNYRNGDPIPQAENPEAWSNLTTGDWCYYENRSENNITYGKLYNWYAVNDPRGIAPEGWHVASDTEWQELVTTLGGEKAAGTKLKSQVLWKEPLVGVDNSTGFTAIPSGFRSSSGRYALLGTNSSFWTATENNSYSAWYREMYNSYSAVYRISTSKTQGFAVRCVKD